MNSRPYLIYLALCMTILSALQAQGWGYDREETGRALLGSDEIVVYNDGFWRYADPEKSRCEPIPGVGRFCGTNTPWTIHPNNANGRWEKLFPLFAAAPEVRGQAYGMLALSSEFPITLGDVQARILNKSISREGLRGLLIEQDTFVINGQTWTRFVFQNNGVLAVSFTAVPSGFILTETHEDGTTLFRPRHDELHRSLIAGLEFDKDD